MEAFWVILAQTLHSYFLLIQAYFKTNLALFYSELSSSFVMWCGNLCVQVRRTLTYILGTYLEYNGFLVETLSSEFLKESHTFYLSM